MHKSNRRAPDSLIDLRTGDSGYFRMEAFKNMCGVADCNSFPDLYGA